MKPFDNKEIFPVQVFIYVKDCEGSDRDTGERTLRLGVCRRIEDVPEEKYVSFIGKYSLDLIGKLVTQKIMEDIHVAS